MSPDCSFCQQAIKDGETVIVSGEATISIHDRYFELKHSKKPSDLSHKDCWEGRNRFAPARRRVIKIEGVSE